MSKRYCMFLTTLFCAFIGLLLVANAIAPDKTFSPMENRNLEPLPIPNLGSLSPSTFGQGGNVLNGDFMSQFETYVTDQFVGRDGWIGLKSTAERALAKQENNGVYLCEGDTLISRFETPDAQRVEKNTNYLNQFVANAGVPVYFSLVPGAVSVWADRLPAGAPNADQKALIDGVAAKTTAQYYDSYAPLWAHRSEDIYYRTDHHWTSLGAYYGYAAMVQAMGMTPVPLTQYEKKTVTETFYGTTFSSSGVRHIKPDRMDIYVPDPGVTVTSWYSMEPEQGQLYAWDKLQEKDKYALFLGGNQSLCVIKNPKVQGPKLLILRDSYTDSMVPFLLAHFSEIHLIDLRYNRNSVPQYIRDNAIDQAVMLYSAANFATDSNFFTLKKK